MKLVAKLVTRMRERMRNRRRERLYLRLTKTALALGFEHVDSYMPHRDNGSRVLVGITFSRSKAYIDRVSDIELDASQAFEEIDKSKA
jgi:hypothetical protein